MAEDRRFGWFALWLSICYALGHCSVAAAYFAALRNGDVKAELAKADYPSILAPSNSLYLTITWVGILEGVLLAGLLAALFVVFWLSKSGWTAWSTAWLCLLGCLILLSFAPLAIGALGGPVLDMDWIRDGVPLFETFLDAYGQNLFACLSLAAFLWLGAVVLWASRKQSGAEPVQPESLRSDPR